MVTASAVIHRSCSTGPFASGGRAISRPTQFPGGLLRVSAQLNPGESVGGGDLPVFASELVAEITKS